MTHKNTLLHAVFAQNEYKAGTQFNSFFKPFQT